MTVISVDTSTLENIINSVNSDKSKMEGVKSKLDSSFSALTECGLFESCLADLKKAADNIISTYDALNASIKSHLDDVTTTEDAIQRVGDDYRSYYTPPTGSGNGTRVDDTGSTTSDVDDGKKVDAEKLDKVVDSMNIESVSTVLGFMSLVKDGGKSLMEIIFDETNSEYCANLLKTFYTIYGQKEVEYDDASVVQKKFLKLILNSEETLPANLTDVTVLQFKEYLTSIAKANNITAYDLVMEDKYKSLLKESLQNLYDKKVDSSKFDDEYCDEFKAFVNMKANSKNKTPEELFADFKNLL